MPPEGFEDFADAYDAMIDWDKRLGNEEPFFRWVFDRVDARSVLDVACGTGHHINLFRSWNLRVEGADLSEAMIARCRSRWDESDQHRFSVRRFDQPVDTPALFDVAVCLGNSLALAEDLPTAARALGQMLNAVRGGGVVVVQVLNLGALPDGPIRWQKCKQVLLPHGQSLVIKGVHRAGRWGYVDILVTQLATTPPKLSSESVPLLMLESTELEAIARAAGAREVEFFGAHDRRAFDPATSPDLIMLATR